MNNNLLQRTADTPDLPRGYCAHQAKARVGNYAITPDASFASFNTVHNR